jgi:ATP-dependent DNA helicase DinG
MGLYPDMQYIDYANLPIVIAASSVELQKVILTEYVPRLSRILLHYGIIRTPVTAVVRKGKGRYLCSRRLEAHIKFENDPLIKRQLERLQVTPEVVDLAEINGLPTRIKNIVCVSGRCSIKTCPRYEHCHYAEHIKKSLSNEYDIQICSHRHLLADTIRRAEGQKPLIPNYQLLILEESNKFFSVARSMYSRSLSSDELPKLIDGIKRLVFINPETKAKFMPLLDLLADKNNRLFKNLIKSTSGNMEREAADIDSDAARHLRKIREFAVRLSELLEPKQVKPESMLHLQQISSRIDSFLKKMRELAAVNKNTYRYGHEGRHQVLYSMPKEIDSRLFKDQWSKGIPTIFISDAASAADDSVIKRTLGLERLGIRLI